MEPLKIDVKVVKDIPKKEIANYVDKVVMGVARQTLDLTDSLGYFPRLTGALQEASMAQGVVQENHNTYYLGARGVNYAPRVWEMGEGTRWTNPRTKPQWYVYTYETYQNTIMENAIKQAESELKE